VLSWKPRALLFPNFATKEKCEAIIALAQRRLHPSALALRKGETADSTKDIRTRWVPVALSAISWLTTDYHMSSWVTFCEKFNVPLNHTLELKKIHENPLKSRDNYSGEEGPSNGACLYWALLWRSRMELMNWTVFVETLRQLRDIFESEWGQNRSIGLGGGENGKGNYDTSSSWRGLPPPSQAPSSLKFPCPREGCPCFIEIQGLKFTVTASHADRHAPVIQLLVVTVTWIARMRNLDMPSCSLTRIHGAQKSYCLVTIRSK
jgi:hypothetical protein